MKQYQKEYKACVENKNTICENIKNVMVKVCFRKPEELKIEQLEQNFDQLNDFEEPIQELKQQSDQLKVSLNHIRKDFFDYEQKMKVYYYNESDSLLYDNDKLIDQLGIQFKIIGDQIKKIDNEIKDKEIHMEEYLGQMESVRSQFTQAKELNKLLRGEIEEEKTKLNEYRDHQDYNKDQLNVGKFQDRQDLVNNMNTVSVFTEFVSQLVDCTEQNDRLKKLLNEFVKSLMDKLNDLENAVKNLEEGLVGTKVEQCQNLIKAGQNACDQIQTEIKNLENKLNMLEANADKAGNEDKIEIQQEIEKTQQLIEDIKQQREKFKRELTGLSKNQGEDLISREADIKELVRQIQNIQEKKIKEREKEVDEIEEQVIQAIRKRRGDKRKECLDEFQNAQLQERELEKVIDVIENKIEQLNNEISQLQNNQTYHDQERNKDLKEKLKDRVIEEQRKLKDLSQQKEQVQEKISGLALGIESITQNIVSSQALTLQAKELGIKIAVKTEVNKGQVIAEEVDTVKAISDELHEKYEQKNKIHQDCIQKKERAISKLNQNDQTLAKLDKTLDQIQQLLGKTIIPDTQKAKAFQTKLQEKYKHLEQIKDNILKKKEKQKEYLDRVEAVCKDLDQLGDKVVLTRELVHVRDELGKVEMEMNDHQDNIRSFQYECDEIMQDAKYIIDENIKNKEEELIRKIKDFQEKIADNDQTYKEVQNKLEEYQKIIKDGFMITDKQVQSQIKIILGESQQLEEQLKKLEKNKNNLKVQEKIIIEKLSDIRQDPKLQSIQELDNLSKLITNTLMPQSDDLLSNLDNQSTGLDKRIDELRQFLSKFDQLQSMNTEFDQLMRQVGRNYKNFLRKLGESADISDKLRPVLQAMSQGIEGGDYKMKEALIFREQEELEDVVECFLKLEEMKETIEPQIMKIKNDSSGTVDADNLQNLISTVMELLDQLEQSEFNANNCTQRLNKIKDTLYSASDVPILIQQREKEITEFSTKLRKVEADYQDLKRQLIGRKSIDNFQDIQQEIRNLDSAIQVFREQRVLFKRILGQELQIFLPNPQVLEDLDILTETIIKIIELGNETNKALDEISKVQTSTIKLKRQLGGLDLMKRYKELQDGESEQRRRLEEVKKRLDRIGKGTADCDGYTSNTEEATFIETLRNELPEMSVKQNEAIDECNQIFDSLEDMQKDVEQASDLANDEDLTLKVSESLEFLEDQLGLNERTATFLEKLADKLEEHFLSMDVKKKLDKRQMELQELENICEDFDFQLAEMHSNLSTDISKIEERSKSNNRNGGGNGLVEQLQMQQQQVIMVDEDGKQVNIIEEMVLVQDELQQVLENIIELQVRNQETQLKREEAQQDFDNKIVKNSPYKKGSKITSKTDVFYLLKANGLVKKKIIDMIKQLKEISKRMRECKKKYDTAKTKIDRQNKSKRYRAHKGDIVDELFADYINQLNCPVPIKRLGNNQYMFGTRKIFAKIINGKLVIRVGGGYMGIEEFMMYYGQQELQRIAKKDAIAQQENDEIQIEDVDSDQEMLGSGRKSRIHDNTSQVDIDLLKKKLRQNSARKKSMSRSIFEKEEESKNNDNSTQVVGLGDMRKALKQNLIEIKTYQEHNSVSQMTIANEIASRNQHTHSEQVSANSFIVEKQLKAMEKVAHVKGAAILRNKRSPIRDNQMSSRPLTKSKIDIQNNPSTNSSFLSNKSFYKEDEIDDSKARALALSASKDAGDSSGISQSLQSRFQSKIPGIKKSAGK